MDREKTKIILEKYRDLIPVRNHIKLTPIPLPGTLERLHFSNPFHFSSSKPKNTCNLPLKIPHKTHEQHQPQIINELFDAETGEKLTLTQSTWNNVEGRVNLDHDSILKIGTGALDISKRINNVTEIQQQIIETPHPIISQFLKSGPINPQFHRYWDPLTNNIDPPSIDAKYDMEDDAEDYLLQGKSVDFEVSLWENDLSQIHQSSRFLSTENSKNYIEKEEIQSLRQESTEENNNLIPSHLDPSCESTWTNLEMSFYHELLNLCLSAQSDQRPPPNPYLLPPPHKSSRSSTPSSTSSRKSKAISASPFPTPSLSSMSTLSESSTATPPPLPPLLPQRSTMQSLSTSSLHSSSSLSSSSSFSTNTSTKSSFSSKSRTSTRKYQTLVRGKGRGRGREGASAKDNGIPLDAPNFELSQKCRRIAHLKMTNLRQVVQAVKDEEQRQALREARESALLNASSSPQNKSRKPDFCLAYLQATHVKEREGFRCYLAALQHDNEVRLIRLMREESLLW